MESTESLASAVREHRDLTHETGNKAADALRLLGLVERHGWSTWPSAIDGKWWVVNCGHQTWTDTTLIEALTEASNCNRCCGRET